VPRFQKVISTHRRAWLDCHRIPEPDRSELAGINDKLIAKQLAKRHGLSVPAVYAESSTLSEAIDIAATSTGLTRFVIKPRRANGGACVRLLHKEWDGFTDVLHGTQYDPAALRRELHREMKRRRLQDQWIVEELLLPTDGSLRPVDDFKFYAFFGRIELILHKRNFSQNGKRRPQYAWYDGCWNPVETGKYQDKLGAAISPPEECGLLIQTARDCSAKLLFPFMRIDLYSTSKGVIFGEFTPQPGTPGDFNSETDKRLAAAWSDAEARLEAVFPPTPNLGRPLGPA